MFFDRVVVHISEIPRANSLGRCRGLRNRRWRKEFRAHDSVGVASAGAVSSRTTDENISYR